jgi:hypothetical protein
MTDPQVVSRHLQRYAKQHSAGAFATPTIKELVVAQDQGLIHAWPGVTAVERRLNRDSTRADFTGRKYLMPTGSRIITHMSCEPGARVPDMSAFDYVFAYVEDRHLSRSLEQQGRDLKAVRISAASEIIGCWGRAGDGYRYGPADAATFCEIPFEVSPEVHRALVAETSTVTEWYDDFPFYSDGTWTAVSLRGFRPDDPTVGVKPSEMSKGWWKEHPEAATWGDCDWTVLADRMPHTRAFIEGVSWWGNVERVRLLRMSARVDGKPGILGRHSDITDRFAGTADGMIARFHLPIVTHPQVTMTAWGIDGLPRKAHLAPDAVWYLDARKPHSVTNASGLDRVHLVVDVIADENSRNMICAGREVQP